MSLLENALRRELFHGCTPAEVDDDLRITKRTQSMIHEPATRVIRDFRGAPKLAVNYSTTINNPYSPTIKLLDVYVDDFHREYWFDPEEGILVQSAPPPRSHQAPRKTLPKRLRPNVAPLRERALALAERHAPSFAQEINNLHPYEEHEDNEIYYFRWDDYTASVETTDDPPHILVGIFANGKIECFRNSLLSKVTA